MRRLADTQRGWITLCVAVGTMSLAAGPLQGQLLQLGDTVTPAMGDAEQVATIAEGLTLDVAATPLAADVPLSLKVDGVFFIPVTTDATAQIWNVALEGPSSARLSIGMAQFERESEDGLVADITYLDKVSGDSRPFAVVLPSETAYLELASSTPVTVTLTPRPPLLPSDIGLGEFALQLEDKLELPLDYAVPSERENLRAAMDLPANITVTMAMQVAGTSLLHQIDDNRPVAADTPADALNMRFARARAFGDDPWPVIPMTLDLAPIDVDEVEPNQSNEMATLIDWPADARRIRVDGRVAGRSEFDVWRLEHDGARALDITLQAESGTSTLSLLDDENTELTRTSGEVEVSIDPLVLPAGSYFLKVENKSSRLVDYTLKLRRKRMPDSDEVAEPNDTLAASHPIAVDQTVSGALSAGDIDHLSFNVTEGGRLWSAVTPGNAEVILLASNGVEIARSDPDQTTGVQRLPAVALPLGSYAVSLTGSGQYDLTLRDLGPVPKDWEAEPNDTRHQANAIIIGEQMRGQVSDGDTDALYFEMPKADYVGMRVHAPDDTQIEVDLRLRGHEVMRGERMARGRTIDQVLWLEEGEYTLSVNRWGGGVSQDPWTVELYEPDQIATIDVEPNSDIYTRVQPGQRIAGREFGLDAYDGYMVPLPAQAGRAYYVCTKGSRLRSWTNGPVEALGSELDFDGRMSEDATKMFMEHDGAPGQALFLVHYGSESDGYDCAVHWATEATMPTLFEGLPERDGPMGAGMERSGELHVEAPATLVSSFGGDNQYHFLGLSLPEPGAVTLSCDDKHYQAQLYDNAGNGLTGWRSIGSSSISAELKTTNGYIGLWGHKAETDAAMCDVTMEGQTPTRTITFAQPIPRESKALVDRPVTLSGHILPGELFEYSEVAFELSFGTEAAVMTHCTFFGADGTETVLEQTLYQRRVPVYTPDYPKDATRYSCSFNTPSAFPSLPLPGTELAQRPRNLLTPDTRPGWTVPESMAGGLNVAMSRFGGVIATVDEQPVKADTGLALINGTSHLGGLIWVPDGGDSVTYDLAGETPVPLVGVHYTYRPASDKFTSAMRQMVVSASTDGKTFEEVGRYDLSIAAHRQYLPFDTPVKATHIRVAHPLCRERFCMRMSEFGVIAVPGVYPASLPSPPNLADPALGGRLISGSYSVGALTEKQLFVDDPFWMSITEEEALTPTDLLIGFWRDRVAEIDRVEWQIEAERSGMPVDTYEVLAVNSILAPPVSLGSITAPAGGEASVLQLPEGTRARYLILRADLPEGRNFISGSIKVFEAAARDDYLSILGTWDEDDPKGPFEWFNPLVPPALPAKIMSSEAAPFVLEAGDWAQSNTRKEDAADWFNLPGDPAATDEEVWRVLTLSAPEILEVGATLQGADGTTVELISLPRLKKVDDELYKDVNALDLLIPQGYRDDLTLLAKVDPRQDYNLRIAEEARLLIMRRERTGMLSHVDAFRQRGYRDLAALLGDGEDAMDLGVPDLEGNLLLRGRDNIELAMARLPDPARDQGIGTSDFGSAVAASGDTLRHWPGGKGIVYFGMGGGIMATEDMDWVHKIQDVPVRTRSVLAPCNEGNFFCPDPVEAELNAMTFAASTGGDFIRTTTRAGLRRALTDAAEALTGPKSYAVSWQDIPVPPPLAELTIKLSEKERIQALAKAAGPPSLAVILDASGSMLKRLDGTRRIAVAQAALTDLVETTVPDGTHVSFRAFGLVEDACNTEVLSPLAPLDRTAISAAINSVRAINLAKTAIADSIRAAAAEDLAQATGPRAIILITDGEETCDGDVASTLTNLKEAGIDITLSIVGFAIDDEALKADFDRWAELGNGGYFDASNRDGLQSALSDALAEVAPDPIPTRARIAPQGDTDVAPVTLALDDTATVPPGRYIVTLDTGRALELELGAGDRVSITSAQFNE